jgi:SNF2 family DNA or RNA helicase
VQAAALKLRQLCVTTAHVDEDTNHSAKFDAFVKKLKGDWSQEQAIVFVKYKDSIKALEDRLAKEGIRFITITGDVSQKKREELRQQFWADRKLQVLIGTTAIERSLNLQCARIQLNLDFMKNPSRHTQFAGRVRRVGSRHKRVYVFFFGIVGTLEEAAYRAAQESQAVADHVFDEESDLYAGLTKRELLKLIKS